MQSIIKNPLFLATLLLMLHCRALFAADDGKITLRSHKPVYFIVLDNKDVKFEISFKVKLASDYGFYFGYTQKSFWDLFEKSSPFRESNYNPEIFWEAREGSSVENGFGMGRTLIGVEHESNGMGGEESRSWNRVYVEQRVSYNPPSFDNKTKKDFLIFSLKLWPVVQAGEENKDITDYQGYGELSAEVNVLPVRFFVKARKGTRSDAGSVESSLAMDIPSLNVYPFVQYWYGYGESLLKYDELERRWGIGVMMRM
ncbi:MAG: phospholipase A [Thermodesulfobacteriota bacterium]